MTHGERRLLVLAMGNPARLDDGIGPVAARRLAELVADNVTVQWNYQLNIEDAATVARHDAVVFIDASMTATEPFVFEPILAANDASFSSHSVSPAALLYLTNEHFDRNVSGHLLAIRGYRFDDFAECLSLSARHNLEAALEFIVPVLARAELESPTSCVTTLGEEP